MKMLMDPDIERFQDFAIVVFSPKANTKASGQLLAAKSQTPNANRK